MCVNVLCDVCEGAVYVCDCGQVYKVWCSVVSCCVRCLRGWEWVCEVERLYVFRCGVRVCEFVCVCVWGGMIGSCESERVTTRLTHVLLIKKIEQNRTEQNRTEQNRTEQNRTEQKRTKQNRIERNGTYLQIILIPEEQELSVYGVFLLLLLLQLISPCDFTANFVLLGTTALTLSSRPFFPFYSSSFRDFDVLMSPHSAECVQYVTQI
jgi:hypothetical protein